MKITFIGLAAVILFIVVGLGITIVNKFTPSKEVMPLTEYYTVDQDKVMVILQDRRSEVEALYLQNQIYIDYTTVSEELNHRFYWDTNENVLTYTTPTEIYRAEAGNKAYTVTKTLNFSTVKSDYDIVKVFADKVYIALDFVAKHSDMTYEYYEKPNRVVIHYRWDEYLFTEVTKETQLRMDASIKSPLLLELAVGTSLMYVEMDQTPKKGFAKVMTEDGIVGYVREKDTKKSYYKDLVSNYVAPEYTSSLKQEKINLVFHQYFNQDAAGNLENLIKDTKKVNVVSPTWFDVIDTEGNISSLASHSYVEKAKSLGLDIWALVGDVNIPIDMEELLSKTSARDRLSNELIQAALEYKVHGINVDFETISNQVEGKHFIQFLRELSVKCRNNGLVLSVDNYVPAPYNSHYGYEEQGEIVDYVVIMAYNEFTGNDGIGPVSSIGFVQKAIEDTVAMVPKEKTVIAIPFYTKLWKEAADGSISNENLAMSRAAQVFTDNQIESVWDEKTSYYYGEYKKDGATYRIWQEEERSIEVKMKAIYDADVAGVAIWKLGLERPSVWDVMIKYINK